MLQLYLKQLRAHFVLALVFAIGAWRGRTLWPNIASAEDRTEAMVLALAWMWGILGLFLGFDGFQRERTADTYSVLRHRGLAAWRAIAARSAASYTVLVAVFGVACLAQVLDAAGSPFHRASLSANHAGLAVLAAWSSLPGHAVGVLCAQLGRSRWIRVLTALLAGIGMLLGSMGWQAVAGDWLLPNEFAWVAWIVAVSACLYFLSARAFRRAYDETRPFEGWIRAASGLVLLFCLAPTALAVVAHFERRAIREHIKRLPSIDFTAHGLRLVDPLSIDQRLVLGAPFDPALRIDPWRPIHDSSYPHHVPRPSPFQFGEHWKPLAARELQSLVLVDRNGALFRRTVSLGERNGRVLCHTHEQQPEQVDEALHRLVEAPELLTLPCSFELERSDGRRFSPRTWLLLEPNNHASTLLADDADRTLWTLDASMPIPMLQRVELPGGDDWLGFGSEALRVYSLAFSEALQRGDMSSIRGTKAIYEWTVGGLVKSNGYSHAQSPPQAVTRVLDDDLLEPHVIVQSTIGGSALQHRYALETRDALEIYASAALRSPLTGLAVYSGLDSFPVDESSHPLYVSGRRPWLLALNAALSMLVASWLVRRRALALRHSWWLLALLVGPGVVLFVALIEPWRRPSPPPAVRRVLPRIAGVGAMRRQPEAAST
jgi:hypothetical protein